MKMMMEKVNINKEMKMMMMKTIKMMEKMEILGKILKKKEIIDSTFYKYKL